MSRRLADTYAYPSFIGGRIPPALRGGLESLARERDWPLSAVIREGLERRLGEDAGPRPVGKLVSESFFGCRVPPALRQRLVAVARERGWPEAAVVREALQRYMDETATARSEGGAQPPPSDSRSRWRAPSG